jgi:uncharacterized protein YcbK (DUF882 family)
MHRLASALAASIASALIASPSGVDAAVHHGSGLAVKKEAATPSGQVSGQVSGQLGEGASGPAPLLATLVQTHTGDRVLLDDASPTHERFDELLADRVTGQHVTIDPKLLGLLRALAKKHADEAGAPVRIEIVSGYRSAKRNEMMRKKGHHVASHSQHSLGHACDFRLVLPNEERGIDPRVLEKEIRELGWDGGVGVYTTKTDWFVHADVGRNRRWTG